jgi:hypothetical protein
MEAPAPFSTRHLYSSGHLQWHCTRCCCCCWLFHRVRQWWTCTGLKGTALLENTLSKNKSTATLISITTYSTGSQWDAWAVTRPKFDSRIVNYFFFVTTTKPVLTDSLASCQVHTNIPFPGGKDKVLLSSPITLSGVWSSTTFPLGNGCPIRGPRQHLQFIHTI